MKKFEDAMTYKRDYVPPKRPKGHNHEVWEGIDGIILFFGHSRVLLTALNCRTNPWADLMV